MVRRGIANFLQWSEDIEVCGEADSGERALELVAGSLPDVVLMDLSMPGMGGIEATQRIKKQHPTIKVIVLTSYAEDEMVFGALEAGAESYLLKNCSPDKLDEAVKSLMRGSATIDPVVAPLLIQKMQRQSVREVPSVHALTPREKEVLYWIAQGRSNKEIGDELCIGIKTVKTHVSHLLEKLALSDRTQLAIYAHQNGYHEAP